MLDSWLSIILVAAFALTGAGLILLVLDRLLNGRPAAIRAGLRDSQTDTVFLFEGDSLVDATPSGHRLLRHGDRRLSDWDGLLALLGLRFPAVRERLEALPATGEVVIDSDGRDSTLRAEFWEGMVRLSVQEAPTAESPLDHLRLDAMQEELETLRSIAEEAPQLIWKQNSAGAVSWANRAYLATAERQQPGAPADAWPVAPLFPGLGQETTELVPEQRRVPLAGMQPPEWYDITTVRRGAETIHFAVDASPAMAAEHARRVFVQTLTKTFANLSTGLAIFDRDRRLVLFNPAFVDLTGLPVGFLSAHPHVHSVLDRLRDMNMLPEPKNYASWRERVTALETAAENGTYCESWPLASGQTYRVTGRPHPDGAIAFLFEDISDEVSLTRHFRAERDLHQQMMDNMEQGLVVFSASGTLVESNTAYADIWGSEEPGLQDLRLDGEGQRWQERSVPTPFWPALQQFGEGRGSAPALSETVRLLDGRAVTVQARRLSGGAVMVAFRPVALDALQPKLEVKTPRRRKITPDPLPDSRPQARAGRGG
jgi:PAS domain-containing protein